MGSAVGMAGQGFRGWHAGGGAPRAAARLCLLIALVLSSVCAVAGNARAQEPGFHAGPAWTLPLRSLVMPRQGQPPPGGLMAQTGRAISEVPLPLQAPDLGTMPVAPPAMPGPSFKGDRQPSTETGMVPLTLAARITETGPFIRNGVTWRIYEAQPGPDGRYRLLTTLRQAVPTAHLPVGDYLINAAYGLSNLTKRVSVTAGAAAEELFVLNTGGLRLGAKLANGEPLPPGSVRYDIFDDETDQFGNRTKVLSDAKPGVIIRLNAGGYHIVSVYGDANAIVRADVTVEPGRLTEAIINHNAAKVTFRLVQQEGGEALADTQWSVLTPGGDVVKESAGALPTHILAAGEYSVLARHNGRTYSQDFTITAGEVKQVEIVSR